MVRSGTRSPALRRTLGQAGYTLIETLGALADGFTSASKTETDQVSRTDDQEAARQALERMRTDIHCASSALVGPTLDSFGNAIADEYTLNLTITSTQCTRSATGQSQTQGTSSGVQWCTVPVAGTTNRYVLYRSFSTACNSTNAVLQVDHLTSSNVWTKSCSTAHLEGVTVDIAVNRNYATRPGRTYELKDTIALRNDSINSGNTAC